jgi:hypothetical protein
MNVLHDFKSIRLFCTTWAIATGLGLLLAATIVGLSEQFLTGVTLSGLNPTGGPGFMLLLPTAAAGWWLADRGLIPKRTFTLEILSAAAAAAVLFATAEFVARGALPSSYPPTHALTSSGALAFLVAAVVAATLRRAHDQPSEATAALTITPDRGSSPRRLSTSRSQSPNEVPDA